MSRAARVRGDSGVYHVMVRGIDRRIIFEDDEDRDRFLACLRAVREVSGLTLYAYCLMDNHVHLLIEEREEPLALLMKRLGVRYVGWFNRKYARSGHLFQDRFRSEPVDTDAYFITVLRYIWRNPVDAGLCERAKDYPWGSRSWLGRPGGLVHDADLTLRSGVTDLEGLDIPPAGDPGLGVRQIWMPAGRSDRQVASLVREISGVAGVSELVRLPREETRRVIRALRRSGASIRQLARLTGIPRTTVERWSA